MSPHACTNLAHPMATPANVDKATMDSTARASKRMIFVLGFLFLPGTSSPKAAVLSLPSLLQLAFLLQFKCS